MTNITTATNLHYLPRDTTYVVLHHNVMMKVRDTGVFNWSMGCVYQDTSSQAIYSRPYEMFNMGKWIIIK